MESSTGTFVAGNAVKNLGSSQELVGDTLAPSETRESLNSESTANYESGWRYEEMMNRRRERKEHKEESHQEKPAVSDHQPDRLDPKDIPAVATPQDTVAPEDLPSSEAAAPSKEGSGLLQPEAAKALEGESRVPPEENQEAETEPTYTEKNRNKPGEGSEDDSDVPMGYSPSSAPTSSKFDKYYHQNLISVMTCRINILCNLTPLSSCWFGRDSCLGFVAIASLVAASPPKHPGKFWTNGKVIRAAPKLQQ